MTQGLNEPVELGFPVTLAVLFWGAWLAGCALALALVVFAKVMFALKSAKDLGSPNPLYVGIGGAASYIYFFDKFCKEDGCWAWTGAVCMAAVCMAAIASLFFAAWFLGMDKEASR